MVANKSKWFSKNIPCNSGRDGTNLTIQILDKSKSFLNANGKLQIPILSLSDKKIIYAAKKNFRKLKVQFLKMVSSKRNDENKKS